jgi:enoyl-CoA hydratase/carnithine racemase
MPYDTIIVDREDHVGIIALNRPDHLNTFSTDMARELNQALLELDDDQDVRVVVVKGQGKAFCAGIDISEFHGKTNHEYRQWVGLMEKMAEVIADMKKPVIASAHGYAVANGAGLVAASDLAIAAEGTKLGVHAVNIGLFCMGPAVPLSRSLGRKRSLELLLTGELIDARKAEEWGIINKVVPEDQLESATMALAKKLAEKSPLAVQMGKRAYYGMSDLDYKKALEYSNEMFAALCVTEDAKEGVEAFLAKRQPVWKVK